MKNILFIALFNLFCVRADADVRAFSIAFPDDFAPFSFSEHNQAVGIAPEIISEVFRNSKNIKLHFSSMPWARAQKLVHDGAFDALVTIPSPDRLLYTTPSKTPAFVANFKIFTYKNHPRLNEIQKIHSIDDLKNYVVCEYNGSGWAKNHLVGKAKRIEYSKSTETKIKMLALKRCDLIIDLDLMVHYNAKKLSINEDIIEIPHSFEQASYHLLINSRYPHSEVMQEFEKNIKHLQKNGFIQKVISKWDHSTQLVP